MAQPKPQLHSASEPIDANVFTGVLADAVDALESHGIDYALIGGLGSACLGRPRWTHDIDVFVAPSDALGALAALEEAGFTTQRTNENWLYKGFKNDVLVDVLFKTMGDMYFDDHTRERRRRMELDGVPVWVAPPEDLIVVKAIAHDEDTPRHWGDALGLIAAGDIDWDYLIERAGHGAKRVLSLLVYAQSRDFVVPDDVIRRLFDHVYDA